jgi:hypothetical protein
VRRTVLAAASLAALLIPACSGGGSPSISPTETFGLPTTHRPDVVVPDLVGLTTVAADEALRQVGLYLVVDELVAGHNDKTVARQTPESGAEVAPASVVLVTADCLPASCPSPPIDQFIYDPCTCAHR